MQVPYTLSRIDPATQRQDGTTKGAGWLGPFRNAAGEEVTEYSVGVNIDGKEIEIPTLVPGLTKDEIRQVVTASDYGEFPNESVMMKAIAHARKMMGQGKSPFASVPMNLVQKVQEP